MDGVMRINLRPAARDWGVQLAGHEKTSRQSPIIKADPPDRVILSLHQNIGEPSSPIVKPGQRVLKGEPVSVVPDGALGSPVHASISGTVISIAERPVPAIDHDTATCIEIVGDGTDEPWTGYSAATEFARLTPEQIQQGISQAGIAGLGGALFPTGQKLKPHIGAEVIILNGAECEPYISCDNALLIERSPHILAGAQLLLQVLQADCCIVALKSEMVDARQAVGDSLHQSGDDRIRLAIVPDPYPAGGERQLIEYILEREVPTGGLPRDVGAFCQNVATAYAIGQFFTVGEPLISRVVTVTGQGIRHPQNIEARIGTPIHELVELAGGYTTDAHRLIMGGPMMGIALADDSLPITRATNCLLVAGPNELAGVESERPCIRCGDCAHVCPARLMPQDLLALARTQDLAQLQDRGIDDCIECGACDYVCPSYIPITARLVEAKQQVARQRRAAHQALHARQRFETREQRLDAAAEQRSRSLAQQIDKPAIDEVMRRIANRKRTDDDQ
jgi:electron transport complex protein RnfC